MGLVTTHALRRRVLRWQRSESKRRDIIWKLRESHSIVSLSDSRSATIISSCRAKPRPAEPSIAGSNCARSIDPKFSLREANRVALHTLTPIVRARSRHQRMGPKDYRLTRLRPEEALGPQTDAR